jgi:hypothetical protein
MLKQRSHPGEEKPKSADPGGFAAPMHQEQPTSPMAIATSLDLQTDRWVVRYRGFVLIPQSDLTWLVRPERSPMQLLPFRAPASSVADVKALVDWRLNHNG